MNQSFNMEKILEKLLKKELTVNEIRELSLHFKNTKASETFDKYFLKIWDTSHKINSEVQSDTLLKNVHNQLGIIASETRNKKTNVVLINFLKYAAVFIVAFAVSALMNYITNKQVKLDDAMFTNNNEISVSYGSKTKIKLPDGSLVNLNSGSLIVYPAVFSDRSRNVHLVGEAYFEVKTDTTRPFIVNTSEIRIIATGTVFNVKAYAESNTIETTLISGTIEVSDKPDKGFNPAVRQNHLLLKPNQKAIYVKDLEKLTLDDRRELKLETTPLQIPKLSLVDKVDAKILTAWKDNKLIFNNEKFEDLCIRLERWYNVKITLKARELRKERFTGSFENETVEQVLDAMKIATPFSYNMEKNDVLIYRD